MRSFELDCAAEAELNHLIEYVADDSPDAASRLLREFDELFEQLAASPNIGFHRESLASWPVRFAVHRRYLVAYDPDSKPLRIIGIVHGLRHPKSIADVIGGR